METVCRKPLQEKTGEGIPEVACKGGAMEEAPGGGMWRKHLEEVGGRKEEGWRMVGRRKRGRSRNNEECRVKNKE